MKIDLRQLKRSGKEEEDFSFDFMADNSILTLPDAKFAGPVKITGTIEVVRNSARVEGTIEYQLVGLCSRCLEPASYEDSISFDELYTNEDDDNYHYEKDVVDLTQMVNEKIMLSLPYAIYCKDDCKGLCPVCGANLNNGPCNCNKI